MNTKKNDAPTSMLEASKGRITAVPVAGLRCTVLQQRRLRAETARGCLGSHHEVETREFAVVVKEVLSHSSRNVTLKEELPPAYLPCARHCTSILCLAAEEFPWRQNEVARSHQCSFVLHGPIARHSRTEESTVIHGTAATL